MTENQAALMWDSPNVSLYKRKGCKDEDLFYIYKQVLEKVGSPYIQTQAVHPVHGGGPVCADSLVYGDVMSS